MKSTVLSIFLSSLLFIACSMDNVSGDLDVKSWFRNMEFNYSDVSGIGYEKGCTRRDPSDVIKVGDKYYVYYTKVYGRAPGYWGTIWVAVSDDDGYNWTEIGEVLGLGKKGSWDSQATFTPNVIVHDGIVYLYYTGVQPTPTNEKGEFEDNSVNDYTALGVAMAENPEGPFIRSEKNPILTVSSDHNVFDSYRVDDAVLLKKEDSYWLYYKGRKYADGQSGPRHTEMGVAFAEKPEGPFVKHNKPILSKSHEVLVWPLGNGVAALASISSTLEYAPDGLGFDESYSTKVENRPNAPGLFRPELTDSVKNNSAPAWGISMVHNGSECYLKRWAFKKNNK